MRHLREFLADGDTGAAPMRLNESITAVLRLAGPEARRRGITIHTDLGEDLPLVSANPIQIEQVVFNLLNNAIEAIAAADCSERAIRLTTEVAGDDVTLAVIDSGPGLPDQDVERLFNPFFTTKQSGMGLGLSISRSIVGAYGGLLTASAAAQGGAEFRVVLPAISD